MAIVFLSMGMVVSTAMTPVTLMAETATTGATMCSSTKSMMSPAMTDAVPMMPVMSSSLMAVMPSSMMAVMPSSVMAMVCSTSMAAKSMWRRRMVRAWVRYHGEDALYQCMEVVSPFVTTKTTMWVVSSAMTMLSMVSMIAMSIRRRMMMNHFLDKT